MYAPITPMPSASAKMPKVPTKEGDAIGGGCTRCPRVFGLLVLATRVLLVVRVLMMMMVVVVVLMLMLMPVLAAGILAGHLNDRRRRLSAPRSCTITPMMVMPATVVAVVAARLAMLPDLVADEGETSDSGTDAPVSLRARHQVVLRVR